MLMIVIPASMLLLTVAFGKPSLDISNNFVNLMFV